MLTDCLVSALDVRQFTPSFPSNSLSAFTTSGSFDLSLCLAVSLCTMFPVAKKDKSSYLPDLTTS